MNVLVTGGAGYIGSIIVKLLVDAGYDVTVLDDLESGYPDAIDAGADLIEVDLRDARNLRRAMAGRSFAAVIHMASSIVVSESERKPLSYYENNVSGTINLLTALEAARPEVFVLSSTAAVYSEDIAGLISEDSQLAPNSCYGMTKLVCEDICRRFSDLSGTKLVIFRYFNAAGAWATLGERHEPETHLVPRLLAALACDEAAVIYGNDYPTSDGTPVRDYVHVLDIADAHIRALTYRGAESIFNLGTGKGNTVLEVVKAVERVTGQKLELLFDKRRQGDAVSLVASSSRALLELGWKANHSALDEIVGSAFSFMRDRAGKG